MTSNPEALLDAGAILPDAAGVMKLDTVTELGARTYRHPVLGDRPVVRLVPTALGAAEDLSMEFLGFTRPDPAVEVGVVRQQALGFPAWALVNDPANGHHALALVKEIERLARMAKSRVGPAKDGFQELGERLARSVPHFLPTYFEEAARAFVTADSPTYAAMMFGKAREAERVYALDVDEERTHTVFLEFALAGALTAKALTTYAKDLAQRGDPAAGFDRFRRLCVERTLGGLPPYAAMPTDLRRLAKAAKLDTAVVDQEVLSDLLAAPAVQRAPEAFWTGYRPALVSLARADARVRGQLLGFFPANCDDLTWLTVLEEAGATAALTDAAGAGDPAADPTDGPAGWLSRAITHHGSHYYRRNRLPWFYALVEKMASRLVADGTPVDVFLRGPNDVELLDCCLSLGIPIVDPPANLGFAVHLVLENGPHSDLRDLTAVAADERFLPALVSSLDSRLLSSSDHEKVRVIATNPGLRTAAARLWDQMAEMVVNQGLPTLDGHLNRARRLASPEGLAINPTAVTRIAGHDIGAVLGRTLRAGVLDEYGWPAFESTVLESAAVGGDLVLRWQWPNLVVCRGKKVTVVGPDGVLFEHHLRIPKDHSFYPNYAAFRFVGGQLLVGWWGNGGSHAYWSGAPDDIFTASHQFDSDDQSLPVPGGGRTAGGLALRVGDRSEQRGRRVVTDGQHFYVMTDHDNLCELDPHTGELGRQCLPAFFEHGVVDGESLMLGACSLRVMAPSATQSPFGSIAGPAGAVDGAAESTLVGWRVRRSPDGALSGEGVDGRGFRIAENLLGGRRDGRLGNAIRFPGSDETFGVFVQDNWRSQEINLCASDGLIIGRYESGMERPPYSAGTPVVPPPGFWHHLRPRDEAGSLALRALSDSHARQLLEAAAATLADTTVTWSPVATPPMLVEAVGEVIPQVTDTALRQGIAGVVWQAARHAVTLGEFTRTVTSAPDEPTGEPQWASDGVLAEAFGDLLRYCIRRGDSALRLIAATGEALVGSGASPTVDVLSNADIDWFDTLTLLPAAMVRASSPFTSPRHRAELLTLLDACAESGLLTPGSRTRRLRMHTTGEAVAAGAVIETAMGGRLLVLSTSIGDANGVRVTDINAIEYSPTGEFGPIADHTTTSERLLVVDPLGPDAVTRFTAMVREVGPAPWRDDLIAAASTAAGVSLAEATLLMAGLPIADKTSAEWSPPDLPISATVRDCATNTWSRLGSAQCAAALAALLPADPTRLWDVGPDLARLRTWGEPRGVRIIVDDELIVAAHKSGIAGRLSASMVLHGLANARTCPWLTAAGWLDGDDNLVVTVTRALMWLTYHLPNGDPMLAALPDAAHLLSQRIADPQFVLALGWVDAAHVPTIATALGVEPVTTDKGTVIGPILLTDRSSEWRQGHLHTAKLSGPDDPSFAVVDAIMPGRVAVGMLRDVLNGRLAALVANAVTTTGTYPVQDPSRSVPDLVDTVAAELNLGHDAATLYLQLLALPDPTDRNVATWTGWKKARLTAARAELVARETLVTEAKRARAGRSLFLPGGWLALKTPFLPVEEWKVPLLTIDATGRAHLGVILPTASVPATFRAAWERVRAGDKPRFNELVTERPRRR